MTNEEILAKANEYLKNEQDEFFKNELQSVIDKKDFEELSDRFYTTLEFGTAGLRGVIGGGDNRINPFNICKATQGLANYLNKNVSATNKSAAIAFDSRLYSDLFAESAARVLAANGIKCFLFSSLRPTPELSFAIRYLGCTTGAVVTASHNPKEYNGFKVYWDNGGQIIEPVDNGIIDEVNKVTEILTISKEEAIAKGLIEIIDSKIDDAYINCVKSYFLRPNLIADYAAQTKIVYTPLNGTGRMPVQRLLTEMGIEVVTVKEQEEPDGNFPTCPFPNPEVASAMKLAVELGVKEKASIVMGTDPDADRFGIAVPDSSAEGGYRLITGNQLGSMLAYYMISTLKEQGKLNEKSGIVKTIVTTRLANKIASSFNVECVDVLTGFKWIALAMDKFEKEGRQYILGFEESYGFNVLNEVRDKDSLGAVAMCCELALYCVSKGITLLDYLNEIYQKYGYYEEFQISNNFEGQKGLATMGQLMDDIRANPFAEIAKIKVATFNDYKSSLSLNVATGEETKIELPSSNVLQFLLEDGSCFTIRPSGTEPKIKFYCSCFADVTSDLSTAKGEVSKKIEAIKLFVSELLKNYR